MNKEIANAMYGYLETLYIMNQKLLKLCGTNIMLDFEDSPKDVLDIIHDIPRLIPYSYNNGNLIYKDRDGLLEFKNDIKYLENDYNEILKENYDFLDKVRKIRNKYTHKIHGVKHIASGSGSLSMFEFSFEVDSKEIDVESEEFIKLLKELNNLFSKIIEEIKVYASENQKKEYMYYTRICRFDFKDFNKLYDSNLLKIIGKSMKNF